ncbi:hypothetical protein KXD93_21105 [Mucilaginibacter sp. BJC16-A38]|uniref:hypothetical protein n=1 Tax=Mucilaginibacter phenanthrenivorans TaxID=1234842 RepID=UPI002158A09B|nr:hypothetical protein [Mucilaginibacter phenanthrenivorans]MCR8560164.1 hypothetical protein [Mucilaginibacter phenanthrenivorans]
MKRILFSLALLCAAMVSNAQTGFNYYPFGIGADLSYMRAYSHVPRQDNKLGANLNLIYNYSPYIPVSLEIQKGQLSGGGLTIDKDKYGRQFSNNFFGIYLQADIHLGELINYGESSFLNAIKNLYFGSGAGFISNSIKAQRTNVIPQNGAIGTPLPGPGKDKSVNLGIPLRIGYEFKLFDSYDQPRSAIDIGYVQHIVFGDGIDGYTNTISGSNSSVINQYRELTIGFKYFFGTPLPYKKLIRP